MSVVQLNYYSNTDTSIEDMQNTLDGNFIGHHRVTLTNYNTTGLPAIAAGSIVENNGSLFKFTTETAISGSPSDGTVYICLVPSGNPTLGTATITPTFINTAPAWSSSKQGWYGISAYVNCRYLEFVMTKSSGTYIRKRLGLSNDGRVIPLENTIILKNPVQVGTYTFTSGKNIYIPLTFTAGYDIYSQYSGGNVTIIESGTYLITINIFNYLQMLTSVFTGYLWSRLNPRILKNGTDLSEWLYQHVTAYQDETNTYFYPVFTASRDFTLTAGDVLSFQVNYNAGFTNSIALKLDYSPLSSVIIKKING